MIKARVLQRVMPVQTMERIHSALWELPLRWRSWTPSGIGQSWLSFILSDKKEETIGVLVSSVGESK